MKNADLWASYQSYTKDATEFARKIAFAAAAICWFFKNDSGQFPTNITWALLFVVGFFAADLLQSLIAALVYRRWIHNEEHKRFAASGNIEGDYEKPRWLDYPAFTCFCLKLALLLLGYLFIARELWTRQGMA